MPTIAIISPKGGTGKSTLAESLRQALTPSELVDFDHQQTITILAALNGKPEPVTHEQASAKNVIYDTPPYNDERNIALMKEADFVIVPIKGGPSDIAAFPMVYKNINTAKAWRKTYVVFNEVRLPETKLHRKMRQIFEKNFPKVRIAKTSLSNLIAFKEVLMGRLRGEAAKQIELLKEEIGL